MPRKTDWRLQERCKCHGKLVGVCRNAANATENWLAFAGTLQGGLIKEGAFTVQTFDQCDARRVFAAVLESFS